MTISQNHDNYVNLCAIAKKLCISWALSPINYTLVINLDKKVLIYIASTLKSLQIRIAIHKAFMNVKVRFKIQSGHEMQLLNHFRTPLLNKDIITIAQF